MRARQLAAETCLSAPDGWICTIQEPTRSLEQNALLHTLLCEVGDVLGWRWSGVQVDMDDIKTIFVAAYRKITGHDSKFVVGIDGQPVMLSWRTRDFGKSECSDFIEYVNAWLAEAGANSRNENEQIAA